MSSKAKSCCCRPGEPRLGEEGARHGQHPEAVAPGHGSDLVEEGEGALGVEVAEVGDGLGGALGGDDEAAAFRSAPDVGDREQLGRERVLALERPAGVEVLGAGELLLAERVEGDLHRVERVGLAGEDAVLDELVEHLRELGAGGVGVVEGLAAGAEAPDHHAVLGQGPGLVGADHGGGSDRLHGGDAPGEHVALGDAPGAEREEDGEHHRELLGEHRHRQGDAREQAVDPLVPGEAPGQHQDHAEAEAPRGDDADDARDLALQGGRLRRDGSEAHPDLADLGARAGGSHLGDAAAPYDQRPGVDEGRVVAAGGRGRASAGAALAAALAHGDRLAGEERLVDREVVRVEDLGVGGHAVALDEDHHVAARHLAPGDPPLLAAADHQRPGAREVLQRAEGVLGLALLVEGDADHHHHEGEERERLAGVAEQQVERARAEQEQEHRLLHHVERRPPQAPRLVGGQLVGALVAQAARGLVLGEAGDGAHVEGGRAHGRAHPSPSDPLVPAAARCEERDDLGDDFRAGRRPQPCEKGYRFLEGGGKAARYSCMACTSSTS